MLTQYQKLRLLTAAGMEGPSKKAVMGMEEKGESAWQQGKEGDTEESQKEELGELAANRGN